MGANRTAWHVLLTAFLAQRAPACFEVRGEVQLTAEPLRPDMLLLRREPLAGQDAAPRTLRRLWELLPADALVEFKSVGRPYRSRNLHRLCGYLCVHYSGQPARLVAESDLCGVLLVSARSPALVADAASFRLHWRELGDGYSSLQGGGFALYVVELDVVARTEGDDLLGCFGHGTPQTDEAKRWLHEQLGSEKWKMDLSEMEGYDELVKKLVSGLPAEKVIAAFPPEMVLAAIPPEQRLAGLPPEQRLAGLPPEELLPALPEEILRALPEEYIAKLPEAVRAAVHAKLGRVG